MFYLTIGVPLGTEIVNNRMVFQVSLHSEAVNLMPVEFRIWSRFLLGASDQDVFKTLQESDVPVFASTISGLLVKGLLRALPDDDLNGLYPMVFLRQGIGEGRDLEHDNYHIIFNGKMLVNPLEYAIWKEADGCIHYGELERRVVLQFHLPAVEIRSQVLSLCRKGLLLAVNQLKR